MVVKRAASVYSAGELQTLLSIHAIALDAMAQGIGPESSMENTPAWDSFEHMNVCLLFEKRFGMKLNTDLIGTATSVRAIAELMP